jgi:uncharacterized protein
MKSIYLTSIILLCILLPTVFATEFPNHYDDYVNDFAKIFSANQTAELRSMLNQVRADTTAEVVVVTVNNLSGYTAQEYTTKLATNWGIGKADKDNGLLILYALNENKIWVATGYGIEGILPDSKIGRMLDDYYVPLRDAGKVNEGIISVTEQLVQVLEDNKAEIISGQTSSANSTNTTSLAIIIIIVAIFIFFLATIKLKSKKDNKKKKYGAYLNVFSIVLLVIYFFSGLFIFLIIAILLMILLRIFGRNPSSPWFVPVGSMGGSGSSGGFSGGGFGGGGFGGGGAGR